MSYKIYLLLSVCAIIFACTDSKNKIHNQKKDDHNLTAQTQLAWDRLLKFDNDVNLNDSPMRLYADGFNQRTERLIDDIERNNLDDNEVFNRITLLRHMANSHKINDSINGEIVGLLAFEFDEKPSTQEVKRRLLKANYLFMKQMMAALERIEHQEDTLPYMISGGELILRNQDMDAVIIVPQKEIIQSVSFTSGQDSMLVSHQKDHFIWVLAKPRSKLDSISALLKLENTDKEILLTKYYEVIN